MVWAREAGFRAIFPPMMPGDSPALYDGRWDPMWAPRQDLNMVVHIHAGFGNPQGGVVEMVRNVFGRTHEGDGVDDAGKEGLSAIDPSLLPKFDPDAYPDTVRLGVVWRRRPSGWATAGRAVQCRPPDRELVRHFEFRAGINKPVNFNLEQISQAFEEDRAGRPRRWPSAGTGCESISIL